MTLLLFLSLLLASWVDVGSNAPMSCALLSRLTGPAELKSPCQKVLAVLWLHVQQIMLAMFSLWQPCLLVAVVEKRLRGHLASLVFRIQQQWRNGRFHWLKNVLAEAFNKLASDGGSKSFRFFITLTLSSAQQQRMQNAASATHRHPIYLFFQTTRPTSVPLPPCNLYCTRHHKAPLSSHFTSFARRRVIYSAPREYFLHSFSAVYTTTTTTTLSSCPNPLRLSMWHPSGTNGRAVWVLGTNGINTIDLGNSIAAPNSGKTLKRRVGPKWPRRRKKPRKFWPRPIFTNNPTYLRRPGLFGN